MRQKDEKRKLRKIADWRKHLRRSDKQRCSRMSRRMFKQNVKLDIQEEGK